MEEKLIQALNALKDAGATKEETLSIMYELVDNSSKYADKPEMVDELLKEKLTLDTYIALRSSFIF